MKAFLLIVYFAVLITVGALSISYGITVFNERDPVKIFFKIVSLFLTLLGIPTLVKTIRQIKNL